MNFIAHDDGKWRCYVLAPDRKHRVYLGCAHDENRQAVAHTVPVYVSPLRLPVEPIAMPPLVSTQTCGDGRLTEATTASTRTRRLLPPVGSGAHI